MHNSCFSYEIMRIRNDAAVGTLICLTMHRAWSGFRNAPGSSLKLHPPGAGSKIETFTMSNKMQNFVLAVMFATALVQPLMAQQTSCVPKAMRPIIDGESY